MKLIKLYFILVVSVFYNCNAANQVTRVGRNYQDMLSGRVGGAGRHKRAIITFPEGSNFVVTLSIVKTIMVKQPKGWNLLFECDMPNPLPTIENYRNTLKFGKEVHHRRQRRAIYDNFEEILTVAGFDADACMKHLECEISHLARKNNQTLIEEIFVLIFQSDFPSENNENCDNLLKICKLPILDLLLNPMELKSRI